MPARESAECWQIDGDYELQLVASEPLTTDPVDVAWDRQGRLYVAEMRDYPMPAKDGALLSRIRLLHDDDGDGIMDRSDTWADQLDHVQGILAYNGGLVATTRTAVLFLKDTDGDNSADQVEELFQLNAPRNVQLQIASPHWGVDNCIYFNNGLDLREIYPEADASKKVDIWNSNISYNPVTGRISPVSGLGQFGACQDDWGRRFFCSNQNPAMTAVMPLWAVHRNPFDHIMEGHEDIAPHGRDAKVYPLVSGYLSSVDHAGTYTSACGVAIYRGDATPDLAGDLFVCEPTGQLVARSKLHVDGVSFRAERVGDRKDFLVSTDEWSRPVNMRNGPDGHLYVCDMYRRFIDHARFFPDGFADRHFMRAGFEKGRIYRLVKKGGKAKPVRALPEDGRQLVASLSSGNAWQRLHAQEKMVSENRSDLEGLLRGVLKDASNSKARLHAMWTLDGLQKLSDEDVSQSLVDNEAGIIENAILLYDLESMEHRSLIRKIAEAEDGRAQFLALLELGDEKGDWVSDLFSQLLAEPAVRSDRWLRSAILSGATTRGGDILASALRHKDFQFNGQGDAEWLYESSLAIATQGDPEQLNQCLAQVAQVVELPNRLAFAKGIADGLRQSPFRVYSLADFFANPPPPCADLLEPLKKLLPLASGLALDQELPMEQRIDAIVMAGEQSLDAFAPTAAQLLMMKSAPEISRQTMGALRRYPPARLADFFFQNWQGLSLEIRQEAITLLASGSSRVSLLQQVAEGKIDPLLIDSVVRQQFANSDNPEVVDLARQLFGEVDQDRARIVDRYIKVLNVNSGSVNVVAGEKVAAKAGCFSCHRVGDKGIAVGPDLVNMHSKSAEVLLTDILDPNRMVSRDWMGLTVSTVDGNSYTGIIKGDGNTTLTLDLPGGYSQTVHRNRIDKVKPLGVSLMPLGLENMISDQEMKDLIAYLQQF